MIQRLPPSLTPLETTLAALLRGLEPVVPTELRLADALRCVAAEMPPLPACPAQHVAAVDGWALPANDLVGASSYSPLPLTGVPTWVEAGDAMPAGCDCVLDPDAVDMAGHYPEVLAEGVPGQGVRRAGSDIAQGASPIVAGRSVGAPDLLVARTAGIETVRVRRPRLRVVNVSGGTATTSMIVDLACAAGADIVVVQAQARDAASIATHLDPCACDLLLTVGGSGVGRNDAAIAALIERGELIAHGIALQPGRTAALGRIGSAPVIALPGSPDQALVVWLALVLPVIDALSARQRRLPLTLPLARKIASRIGVAEVALLAEDHGAWQPLAVGELPLQAIARADAWLLIPALSEGFAAAAPVDAYLIRE
jgi:molybdopterin biosynthesis enzyme